VSEFVESAGGVFGLALIAVLVLALLSLLFGRQVFGLPALIGVLVVVAIGSAAPSLGLLTVFAMAAGMVVLLAVIGMAMSLGPEKPPRAHDERPGGQR
jgi:hypothetical protein